MVAPRIDKYYLATNGKVTGPYQLSKLEALLATGDIGPRDLVWHESFGAWTEIGRAFRDESPRAVAAERPRPAAAQAGEIPPLVVMRNAVLFGGALAGAFLSLGCAMGIGGDAPELALAFLGLSGYFGWWAWLEYGGAVASRDGVLVIRRLRFWPGIAPLGRARFPIGEVALGDRFQLGPNTYALLLLAGDREAVALFDTGISRDMFATALRAYGARDRDDG